MKGIVFTEFLEMVEAKFGYEMVDKIIEESSSPNNGAYTAVGTYPHHELLGLLDQLSKASAMEKSALLHAFGTYMFNSFKNGYPGFFEGFNHAFDFLMTVDGHIHKEVLKLYPDAELPSFEVSYKGLEMRLIYSSYRRLSDFALGLIEASMNHFQHEYDIEKKLLDSEGVKVEFIIQIEP